MTWGLGRGRCDLSGQRDQAHAARELRERLSLSSAEGEHLRPVEAPVEWVGQVAGSRRPASASGCSVSKPDRLVGVESDTAPADVEDDGKLPGIFVGGARVQGRRPEHEREPSRGPLHEPLTRRAYLQKAMDDASLDEAILLALRRSPGSRSQALAGAVGLPRTNFGRRLEHPLQQPLKRLLAAGLIDEDHGRYDLTQDGRRRLAERPVTRRAAGSTR
jgi:hypothetical protein